MTFLLFVVILQFSNVKYPHSWLTTLKLCHGKIRKVDCITRQLAVIYKVVSTNIRDFYSDLSFIPQIHLKSISFTPQFSLPFWFLCFFLVVAQTYSVSIMDEHVLRGNTAILKCHIPSFVSDFVAVDAWIDDEGAEYYPNKQFGIYYSLTFN